MGPRGGQEYRCLPVPFSCLLVDNCIVPAFKILTEQFRLLVFSLRWPELYFKVRKILGTVEGEQSEGYLVDTQNTSLYLVRCQWRAGRVYRRSEAEVALRMTKVPVEACVSCH